MNIAYLISRVFGPTVVLIALTVIAGLRSGLPGADLMWFYVTLFGFILLPVLCVRVWFIKTKRVSDWDISNRRERIVPLIILLGFDILFYCIVLQFHNQVLSSLFLLFVAWMIGFFFITVFWKISGHASIITLAIMILVAWYGKNWWPLFLLIPVVSWSRVVLKHHTLAQVIAGVVYSLCIIILYSLYIK